MRQTRDPENDGWSDLFAAVVIAALLALLVAVILWPEGSGR